MKKETLARVFLILSLAAVIAVPVAARRGLLGQMPGRVIEVHARLPEAGGWSPDAIRLQVGEPVKLRLTSDDVLHGLAIGHSDQPPVDIYPGRYTEISLIFDRPGKYTYYCTRWCGANHWRMRGTIEVSGDGLETPSPEGPPLYVELGIDLDAPVPAFPVPLERPSAQNGARLGVDLPPRYSSRDYLRAHSPWELFQELRSLPLGEKLSDQQVWDLVAWTWQSGASPESVAEGRELYARNCAACHGESGAGDGVLGVTAARNAVSELEGMPSHAGDESGEMDAFGHQVIPPTDFTDMEWMLGIPPARLQGKVLRGGMGTGMPYWGPVLTDAQTWALLDYIWTFSMEVEP